MAGEIEKPETETDKDKTPEEPATPNKPADKSSDTPAPANGKEYTKAELEAAIAAGVKAEREKAEAEANKKKLKDQGEYQKLYEAEQTRAAELERELAEERLGRIREKIGAKYELPASLISRLVGKDEAEIEADAKKVRADLGPAGGSDHMGTPPGGKGNGGNKDKESAKKKMLGSGQFSL